MRPERSETVVSVVSLPGAGFCGIEPAWNARPAHPYDGQPQPPKCLDYWSPGSSVDASASAPARRRRAASVRAGPLVFGSTAARWPPRGGRPWSASSGARLAADRPDNRPTAPRCRTAASSPTPQALERRFGLGVQSGTATLAAEPGLGHQEVAARFAQQQPPRIGLQLAVAVGAPGREEQIGAGQPPLVEQATKPAPGHATENGTNSFL